MKASTKATAERITKKATKRVTKRIDSTWEKELQGLILEWYEKHAREFMWREYADSQKHFIPQPYLVLLSEVMLQQTQTSRIQEKLPEFYRTFPSIERLSQATNAEIIKAWEGLGYNSRALRLRDCAKAVVERFSGVIPSEYEELLSLPGIGTYTASALVAFAFHKDIAIVDVNIRRVYSRISSQLDTTADAMPEADCTAFAERIYPRGKASAWHQAVMDIGALFCTARAPKCSLCPLQGMCASAHQLREVERVKKQEPTFEGKPNRIWRGRIVQILRGVEASEWYSGEQLYNQLFSASLFTTTPREQWLLEILRTLEREAIVEIQPDNRQRASQMIEHNRAQTPFSEDTSGKDALQAASFLTPLPQKDDSVFSLVLRLAS
ncbi:MAG: A/G-specific adenine glycosylase [Candidatus Kapaibacterium sp.]|nr:MAG: A/G-specific adenine glycosylase [Candidatus Kapabacteria bacterium]